MDWVQPDQNDPRDDAASLFPYELVQRAIDAGASLTLGTTHPAMLSEVVVLGVDIARSAATRADNTVVIVVAWDPRTGTRRVLDIRREKGLEFNAQIELICELDLIPLPPSLRRPVTGANGEAIEPGVPRIGVPDCADVAPGQDERVLGRVELRGLELDANGDVVLRLSYRLGRAEWTSEGHGETVVAAHAALREQLVLDRIRVGVRAMYRRGR